jgi:hypothetical protein
MKIMNIKEPFSPQALHWLTLVLEERFGIKLSLKQDNLGLSLVNHDFAQGVILFPKLEESFHQYNSDIPFCKWDAEVNGWNSVLGSPIPAPGVSRITEQLIEQINKSYLIHYDILGMAYWMLNRIEEIGRTDLDNHGRFPAIHSHAFKHNYLERPVVDEWFHILGQVIEKQWPQVVLKKHQFSIKVSHDVDSPSQYQFKPWKTIFRMMAGHLLKRRDIKAFFQAPYIKLTAGEGLHKQDPHNTFDWIMAISEANNLTSAFYFICGRTSNKDADYEPEYKAIRELMCRINKRGHEIGLHPSYGTYQTSELIKKEALRLKNICNEEGIKQTKWGGRMHYLRWEHPTTLQAWNDAGMNYDSTLGYADRPGFRCGTCYEYPAFNPVTQEMLHIRIRPLIAMECTVISDRYMGLGDSQESIDKFLELKEKCRKVSGCYTQLWHNSYFKKPEYFKIYQNVTSI